MRADFTEKTVNHYGVSVEERFNFFETIKRRLEGRLIYILTSGGGKPSKRDINI